MEVKPLAEVQAQIKALKFAEPFDTIVAVARGGIIPATLLQAVTGWELEWIWLHFRNDDQSPARDKPALIRPLTFDPTGRRILLVDDRSRTGATLDAAQAHLTGAALIRTLVVNGRADYVLFDEDCFYFPWRMDLP